MQLHYRMSFDEQGYPMLYVFSGCRAFIRTIPELLFDQTDAEDVDTRQAVSYTHLDVYKRQGQALPLRH